MRFFAGAAMSGWVRPQGVPHSPMLRRPPVGFVNDGFDSEGSSDDSLSDDDFDDDLAPWGEAPCRS